MLLSLDCMGIHHPAREKNSLYFDFSNSNRYARYALLLLDYDGYASKTSMALIAMENRKT